jgi:DNA-binding transcriptional MerR regulator
MATLWELGPIWCNPYSWLEGQGARIAIPKPCFAMSHPQLLIGELARRTGISRQAIRYYERIGVLEPPQRGANGYRRYSPQAQRRLQFVRQAQQLGLSLDEIKALLATERAGRAPCRELKAMLERHLATLDERIRQMQALRAQLAGRHRALEAAQPQAAPARPEEPICPVCSAAEAASPDQRTSG